MLRIKRLYLFILQTFFPLFLATFGVCLFIILMQFLWKYVDDMVGKGIEMSILGEMFFYASLTFVPLALPLAILLASLMAFGNMGERLELLAMKSAGISLIQVMKPLIILMVFVAIGGFFFQNNVLPASQVKFATLIFSMKQTSPELEIPEGTFYKEIPGYSVFVERKDRKTGMMYDMMIYDYSEGFENATVIVADSGKLKGSDDKLYIILTLYNGDSFQNFNRKNQISKENMPYRRENFKLKEILMDFDANFKETDESLFDNRDISKNMQELRSSIDSMKTTQDSIIGVTINNLRNYTYANPLGIVEDSIKKIKETSPDSLIIDDFDQYIESKTLQSQKDIVVQARSKAEMIRNDYNIKSTLQASEQATIRGHEIELHRKFTLSVACLVFLFIGAPLGAIIRKGGLGMPTVISVFLFLFYYIIDILGVKLAKQGVVLVWQGMWFSSAVLFPLGFFLTYKAVNDSAILNADAWANYLKRIIGKRETRNYTLKEVIMTLPDYSNDLDMISVLNQKIQTYKEKNNKWIGYFKFWKRGFRNTELKNINTLLENIIEDLRNSDQSLIVGKLMDYPVFNLNESEFWNKPAVRISGAIIFPVGIIIYLYGMYARKRTIRDLKTIIKINQDLKDEIEKLSLRHS